MLRFARLARPVVRAAALGAGVATGGFLTAAACDSRGPMLTPPTASEGGEGMKEKMLGDYENRVRALSTPEKVFNTFASVMEDGVFYMTPEDLVRSLLPAVDQRGPGSSRVVELSESVFAELDVDGNGLISFQEYSFIITVLTTSAEDFNILFRMYDSDGNGVVDRQEFEELMKARQLAQGTSSLMTTAFLDNPAIRTFLFGPNGDSVMSIDQFVKFTRRVQEEVAFREFSYLASGEAEDGSQTISLRSLAAYAIACTHPKHLPEYRRRLDSLASPHTPVTWPEFQAFLHFVEHADDVARAMKFVTAGGAGFSEHHFQRAVLIATGRALPSHLAGALFHMFDNNGDGCLEPAEFEDAMMQRMKRGLHRPKQDLGVMEMVSRVWECVRGVAE